MDPLTQGLLGASFGQAAYGKALGRRAAVKELRCMRVQLDGRHRLLLSGFARFRAVRCTSAQRGGAAADALMFPSYFPRLTYDTLLSDTMSIDPSVRPIPPSSTRFMSIDVRLRFLPP